MFSFPRSVWLFSLCLPLFKHRASYAALSKEPPWAIGLLVPLEEQSAVPLAA